MSVDYIIRMGKKVEPLSSSFAFTQNLEKMSPNFISFAVFLLAVALATGFRVSNENQKSTTAPTLSQTNNNERNVGSLNTGSLLQKDKKLSPVQAEGEAQDDNGLVEVKEDEIPEGSLVYVLEEPIDAPVDGEIMKTANNIVFRPLFRYRSKQEAQRRASSNRFKRRYFVPKRSYRQTYGYPYYYPQRYYY